MQKAANYPLFRHWYQTLGWIMDRSEKMPRSVRHTLARRLENLSLDVMELVIEAIFSPAKARRHTLRNINLHLDKIRILFRLAYDRRHISPAQYRYISEQLDEMGKMTGGWLKTL